MASYEYTTVFLTDKSYQRTTPTSGSSHKLGSSGKLHNVRETLALKRVLNRSQSESRDTRCRSHGNNQLHCMQTLPTGTTLRNPFCEVLGQKVCRFCGVQKIRERIVDDTERTLREIILRDNARGSSREVKERALLTHVRSKQHKPSEKETGLQEPIRGAVARHNTPDTRYFSPHSRHSRLRSSSGNENEFCVLSMKSILKRLSTTVEDSIQEHKLIENERNNTLPSSTEHSGQQSSQEAFRCSDISFDGEMLSQKLSGVLEERSLPPIHRRVESAASTVSEPYLDEGEEDKNAVDEKLSSDILLVGRKNEEDDKSSEYEEMQTITFPLKPPLMKTTSQLSRYEMFLRDNETTLPFITKK